MVRLMACAAWIGFAGNLSAETNSTPIGFASSAREEDQLSEVIQVTGTRIESEIADVSIPAHVIDGRGLSERSPEVLTDALREAPNVHVQATTVGQGSPYIRGLTGSAVLNLVDGMRLNHAIYRSSPNPYLALVGSHIARRIEVVRGPASVLYGSDAMGGVIQVVTRKPDFDSVDWVTRGGLDARFGSADLSRTVYADLSAGREGFGIGAGFSYLATEDLHGGGDTGRQRPSDYTMVGGHASVLWEPAPDHRTTLDFQMLRQPKTPRYDELVPGFGQTEPSSDVWNYEPLERIFGHLQHRMEEVAPGYVDTLSFDAAIQQVRDDRRTRTHESAIENRERNSSQLLGFAGHGVSQPNSWLSLTWGFESYFDTVSSERKETDLSDGLSSIVASRFPDGSQMNSYGVYTNAQIQIGERFEINAGIRYTHVDTKIAETNITSATNIHLDDVTGALGALWDLGSGVRLVTNLSRGFRAPNVSDLGTLGPRPGNRFNIPSQDLDAEVIYTIDLGVKILRSRFRGEIFGFGSIYRDKIDSVFTGSVTPDGRDVVQSANVNRVWLTGVEARAVVDIRDDLEIRGHVFWTWGEEDGANGYRQPADRIPPVQGLLGLRWAPWESLWLEAFTRFAGPQDRLSDRDIRDPRIDPGGTAGWATGNLRAGLVVGEHWSGTVTVENFTNTSYREHGSGIRAPGVGVIATLQVRY
jgi:outer membrane receptor protein involved in Fe transport